MRVRRVLYGVRRARSADAARQYCSSCIGTYCRCTACPRPGEEERRGEGSLNGPQPKLSLPWYRLSAAGNFPEACFSNCVQGHACSSPRPARDRGLGRGRIGRRRSSEGFQFPPLICTPSVDMSPQQSLCPTLCPLPCRKDERALGEEPDGATRYSTVLSFVIVNGTCLLHECHGHPFPKPSSCPARFARLHGGRETSNPKIAANHCPGWSERLL